MQYLIPIVLILSLSGSASAQAPGQMRVGVCLEAARFEAAEAAGFDYVEIGASRVAALTEEEFQKLTADVKRLRIPVAAANGFIPGTIKLVGPEIDKSAQEAYVARTLGRLKTLGVSTVVFGSGAARRVPDGFSGDEAFGQLVDFCRRIAPLARDHAITIVIEPLRKQETNIINSAKEGLRLVKAVDRPEIKLLVDYYHLSEEAESPDVLLEAGASIAHIHVANPKGRVYPLSADESDYGRFFRNLCAIGYKGGVSVEASTKNFEAEAPVAIAMLRKGLACGAR